MQQKVRVRKTGVVPVGYGFGTRLDCFCDGAGKSPDVRMVTQTSKGAINHNHHPADMIAETQTPDNFNCMSRRRATGRSFQIPVFFNNLIESRAPFCLFP